MGNIEYIKADEKKVVENILHPLVKEWFFSRYSDFSETQKYGVKKINDRYNILISAPTGGTKTLTAFLSIINYLVELSLKNEIEDKIYAVYCSPLKALSNDVHFNLIKPLKEIGELAEQKSLNMQEIRVGLRTGDTTTSERAKMSRKTPHIIVTTPESLAIMITSSKFVEKLNMLEFIIIDEIHAMLNKRGTYLSLTLERLSNLSLVEPVRIGLSATISPLEEVAKFLVGKERSCLIADVKLNKKIEIDLDFPGSEILDVDTSMSQNELYDILDKIIEKNRTTLIFTNTRAATEKMVHHLENRFGSKYYGLIGAHHSSMSKETRFSIEERLRKGELKVVVSSTSLELGLDIGSIDIVVLLKSPKGVARALQRIGRAGHRLHENPRGQLISLDRDDMVECGILMKFMKEGKIDKVRVPKNALDVLAQQIYGMSINKIWSAEDMLETIRKSYCYSELTKDEFYAVVSYLAGDYDLTHRNVYAKIWYDPVTKKIGKKGKLARAIYMTNVGTIPSESFIQVEIQTPAEKKGSVIGQIDESFLERMKKGDVFVLGGQKYQYMFSRGMKAYVKSDVSKNPTIPSWVSEMLPLSFDVALEIGRFRKLIAERIDKKETCLKFISDYLYCNSKIAKEIYNYFGEQESFSEIPCSDLLIVEKFKEEKEYLVFHSLYGRRVNDVLSRSYAYAAANLKYRDIELGVSDNGFYIAGESLDAEKILASINSSNLEAALENALDKTDILSRRFRHCASRSLMILKNYKGREKSAGRQQVHSSILYTAVRKISDDFPILKETRREIYEDLMDLPNAKKILKMIEEEKIKIKIINTPMVSPFGLGLYVQGRSDLIKMEDRAVFLRRMHELQMKVAWNKSLKI